MGPLWFHVSLIGLYQDFVSISLSVLTKAECLQVGGWFLGAVSLAEAQSQAPARGEQVHNQRTRARAVCERFLPQGDD